MVLSALGIAIGIATMVAVVGLSESSRADLMAQLDRLGTNLLTAEAGKDTLGKEVKLPKNAVAMVERIGPVRHATGTGDVDARIRRSDLVPEERTAACHHAGRPYRPPGRARRRGRQGRLAGPGRMNGFRSRSSERWPPTASASPAPARRS